MIKSGRADYLDIAKGIGIILVVIFHVYRGILEAGGHIGGTAFAFADYFTYLFHMPLFFLISGVFVQHSLRKGTALFLREKFVHIYWPYLLWSTVSLLAAVVLSSYVNNSVDLLRLLSVPFLPKFHFWFLFTLMLYFIVCVFVRDIRILGFLAVIGCLLYLQPDVQLYAGRYVHFLIFFVGGVALSAQLQRFDSGRWWPLALAVLVTSAIAGFWFRVDDMSPIIVPAGFAGSYLVLALSLRLDTGPLSKPFRLLGEQSLAIYLLHILASSGTRIVVSHTIHHVNTYVLLCMSVAAGLLLPLVAYKIAKQLRILTLIGLGKDKPIKNTVGHAST